MTARPIRPLLAALVLVISMVAAGCTISSSDGDEETTPPERSATGSDEASVRPSSSRSVSAPAGPSPDELSADLLEAAAAQARRPALGSASTVSSDVQSAQIVLDVISVERTSDATLLEFRLSSPTPGTPISLGSFESVRFQSPAFVSALYLDDRLGGTRYRPLLFDDYRGACTCPYLPLTVGPEPQLISAMFPPLPESTTTVDVNLADTLVVADVAVAAD